MAGSLSALISPVASDPASSLLASPASAGGGTQAAGNAAQSTPAPVVGAGATASSEIVSTTVSAISLPGYTQTIVTRADGLVTTTITSEAGSVVSTTTSQTASTGSGANSVNLWA